MATREDAEQGLRFGDTQVAIALVLGAVLTFIGLLAPMVAGPRGEFLGFGRNYLHDLVHLGTGLAGLAAGYYTGGTYADEYNVAMGAVYTLVVVLGFVFFEFMNGLLALNAADNYLHLALAIVFLGVGALARRESER